MLRACGLRGPRRKKWQSEKTWQCGWRGRQMFRYLFTVALIMLCLRWSPPDVCLGSNGYKPWCKHTIPHPHRERSTIAMHSCRLRSQGVVAGGTDIQDHPWLHEILSNKRKRTSWHLSREWSLRTLHWVFYTGQRRYGFTYVGCFLSVSISLP